MIKVKTTSKIQNWNINLRNKIGDVVVHINRVYVNISGRNSEPPNSGDWRDITHDIQFAVHYPEDLSVAFPFKSDGQLPGLTNVIIGHEALGNSTINAIAIGYYAGHNAVGSLGSNTFIGTVSGILSEGGNLTFIGGDSGQKNKGDTNTAVGEDAANLNIGSKNIGLGSDALKFAEGSDIIHIGSNDEKFFVDTSVVLNFTTSDLDVPNNRINFPNHGLGIDGSFVNLKFSGTANGAFHPINGGGIEQFKIIDSNTLELQPYGNGYDNLEGTESGSFSPQFKYSNFIVIGNGAINNVDKSNMVVLGNQNIVETVLFGVLKGKFGWGTFTNDNEAPAIDDFAVRKGGIYLGKFNEPNWGNCVLNFGKNPNENTKLQMSSAVGVGQATMEVGMNGSNDVGGRGDSLDGVVIFNNAGTPQSSKKLNIVCSGNKINIYAEKYANNPEPSVIIDNNSIETTNIILKSPTGTRFSVGVDDFGTLTTTQL